ncbi:MAG TPA: type I-E CRISPR-associated protein Cas5/CasD [Clostridia bacterium]|nr:type I-E CRISPR-associated protein Cas5/CasD [Clostridia bacterium]
MSTLLLRLTAPLQAWGVQSKFDRRDTQRAPTKSAVIGMLAAALGLKRDSARVPELAARLRFGVRVDRAGSLLRDYHTAASAKSAYVTHRYYLCDALFLVGLEGEEGLLRELEAALRAPWFPLYLGRRSCPPAGPLVLGIREGRGLREALENEPLLRASAGVDTLRLLLEGGEGDAPGYLQQDQPLSFNPARRLYDYRRVEELLVRLPGGIKTQVNEASTGHDPFAALEVD